MSKKTSSILDSQPIEELRQEEKFDAMEVPTAKALFQQQLSRFAKTKKGLNKKTHLLFQRSMTVGGGGAMLQAAAGVQAASVKSASVTDIVVALDQSGSMAGQEGYVIDSVNELIDDLSSERNPERASQFLTIWTFTNNKTTLVYANQHITKARHITRDDYNPTKRGGSTPLYKTMVMCMGGSSLRAEALRDPKLGAGNRKVSKTLFVPITDGKNYNPGAKADEVFTKIDVKTAVEAMLSTERWVIGLGFAGGSREKAEIEAGGMGIPTIRNIDKDRNGWRDFFKIISASATALSAPNSSPQSVQNTFFQSN